MIFSPLVASLPPIFLKREKESGMEALSKEKGDGPGSVIGSFLSRSINGFFACTGNEKHTNHLFIVFLDGLNQQGIFSKTRIIHVHAGVDKELEDVFIIPADGHGDGETVNASFGIEVVTSVMRQEGLESIEGFGPHSVMNGKGAITTTGHHVCPVTDKEFNSFRIVETCSQVQYDFTVGATRIGVCAGIE